MATCAFVTLGCKVNRYETEAMRRDLVSRGYDCVGETDRADLVVVNTCTVTGAGGAKSRKAIRRAIRSGSRVVVTGCHAEEERSWLEAIPDVICIGGNEIKSDLGRILEGETPERAGPWAEGFGAHRFRGATRAFLKVQDGCNLRCSYCVLPRVRGASTSRPRDAAVEEARQMAEAGHPEIVVTGIHLGAWGRDLAPPQRLADLTRAILDEVPGFPRLRWSSLEAEEVGEEEVALLCGERRLCRHLHLPLQSGSNRVRRAMRRRETAEAFLAKLEILRTRVEGISFTTDVIVGFPGETEEDFAATLSVCRDAGFSRIHLFPFSDRRGTEAHGLPGRVPPAVVLRRMGDAKVFAAGLAEEFARRHIGEVVDVLLEGTGEDPARRRSGFTETYLRVDARGEDLRPHELRRVRIRRLTRTGAEGSVIG